MSTAQALCDLLSVHEGDDRSFEHLLGVLGFTRIGSGCWKNVYASDQFPDLVVKHAARDDAPGFAEARNYRTAPLDILPFLVPLLACSTRLQVQPFVEFHDCPETCPGYVPGMYDSGDNNHTHDADGNLVIVDYGQSEQWED